jgi:predicted nucleic acid-binding protein
VARALVDTGALVALVNRADKFHARAVDWFRGFRGLLLTTEAVITEAAYVLAASPQHQRAALTWVQRARDARILEVVAIEDHAGLARIIAKYADLPCDYADASLIWLAEKAGVLQIATIDQGDFSVYRARGRRSFRIVLGQS